MFAILEETGIQEVNELPLTIFGVVETELEGLYQSAEGTRAVLTIGKIIPLVEDIVMFEGCMHIITLHTIYRVTGWKE